MNALVSPPTSLRELQRRMAVALMHPLTRQETMVVRRRDGIRNQAEAEAMIRPNDRLSSFERLEIYNRQYWFRLYSSFEEDFPGLAAIVGRRRFESLMRGYLTDCPSTSFTLRNLGSKFEEWLRAHTEQIGPNAALALDMVRLEWAHIEAFDEPADPAMTAEELAGIGEATRFRLQPYLRLLRLSYPVEDLLIAVRSENGGGNASSNNAAAARRGRIVRRAAALAPEEIFLAVHRVENTVYYRRLDEEEFRLLEALMEGKPLGQAIEAGFAGSRLPEAERAQMLQEAFALWAALKWFAARREDSENARDREKE